MHVSPVARPPIPRNAAAMSKPRASDECAMCTCAPVCNPISKISRSAIVSASGGRVRACQIASVCPAARASSVSRSTSSWSSLCTETGSPVFAIRPNAATIVGWSIRGNRTASYSYVLSLNAVIPPAASASMSSSPPCFRIVPYSATSTCAVRPTQPTFSSSNAALWIDCGTS